MLYEIIEKTNDWKLGDGFLKKAWIKQGVSAEEAQKVLDETRELRAGNTTEASLWRLR